MDSCKPFLPLLLAALLVCYTVQVSRSCNVLPEEAGGHSGDRSPSASRKGMFRRGSPPAPRD
jgi:hypothetical protein